MFLQIAGNALYLPGNVIFWGSIRKILIIVGNSGKIGATDNIARNFFSRRPKVLSTGDSPLRKCAVILKIRYAAI